MSTTLLDEKKAWVARVLGVSFDESLGGGLDWPALRAAFDDAVSSVDKQIEALQA